MATNRELKAEIGTLSEQLGVPAPDTDRLNRADLTKLVEQLREQAAGGQDPVPEESPLLGATKKVEEPVLPPESVAPPAPTTAPEPPPTPPPPPARAESPPPANARYFVAEGRLILTLKGKRGAFKPIRPSELAGGQATLDELVRTGHVVRKA